MAPREAKADAKTTVFWDTEEFPISADSLETIIKQAVKNIGYRGEVCIRSYGEKKPENMSKSVSKEEKLKRLNEMMLDIAWWAVDNPRNYRANVMVIAKNMEEPTKLPSFLTGLMSLDYAVLLVLPTGCDANKVQVPEVPYIWYWESLLAGAKPLNPSEISRLAKEYFRDEEEEEEEQEEEEEEEEEACCFCNKVRVHCLSDKPHADSENEPMPVYL